MASTAENFRSWAREQFFTYRGCVGYVETLDSKGDIGCGSCFHVGEGVFVTARHVIEERSITEIGFDDLNVNQELLRDCRFMGPQKHGRVNIVKGPTYHPDPMVDVACFKIEPYPKTFLPLGGHLNAYLIQDELVLSRTLVLGYPPIPLTNSPRLLASVGEVNALVQLRDSIHPHFIISTMARGGFSGGPVLVAYDENNKSGGTAVLGLVTRSLTTADKALEQGYMSVLTIEPIFTCLELANLLPKGQGYDE